MATLRFRNGKWQVQVRRLGYQARTQSFLNKTDAQRWARQIETELDRTLIPNDVRTLAKVTLAELLIRYRDTVTINRQGLVPEKKRIEVFLRQDWCAYPLAKLNARYFSAYRDDRLKCVGAGTVIRELGLLRSIFETARREWGFSSLENPLASIRKPKAPNGRERRLEPGELAGLSTACATVRSTLLLHGIHMAIETGMRRGELLAIQWKHINFDTRVLHIPVTKTGKPRSIPLTERAREILTERKALPDADARYAFPVSANAFRLAWERCKRRAERAGCVGIQGLRFHDLRHEAVSRFFEMGLNTAEVATISGHKDLRMLFRYTHLKAEDIVAKLRENDAGIAT